MCQAAARQKTYLALRFLEACRGRPILAGL